MDEVIEGSYNGKAMLIIKREVGEKFPFQFGVKKAKLILDHIDEISLFYTKYKYQLKGEK